MASDKVLAEMFAEEHKKRLSWQSVRGEYRWHWKPSPDVDWRPLPHDAIPLDLLAKYAQLDGLETTADQLTPEGLRRILELAKKPLRIEPPDTHVRQIL